MVGKPFLQRVSEETSHLIKSLVLVGSGKLEHCIERGDFLGERFTDQCKRSTVVDGEIVLQNHDKQVRGKAKYVETFLTMSLAGFVRDRTRWKNICKHLSRCKRSFPLQAAFQNRPFIAGLVLPGEESGPTAFEQGQGLMLLLAASIIFVSILAGKVSVKANSRLMKPFQIHLRESL